MALRKSSEEERKMRMEALRWNPGEQGEAIREEVRRYMEEGPKSILELCEGAEEATPIVYITIIPMF